MCSQPEVSQWLETYILLLHFTDYSFLVISYVPFCFLCHLWSVFSSVLFFVCVFSSFPVVSHRGTCISAAHVVLHSLDGDCCCCCCDRQWVVDYGYQLSLLTQTFCFKLCHIISFLLFIKKRDLVALEPNIKTILYFCINN